MERRQRREETIGRRRETRVRPNGMAKAMEKEKAEEDEGQESSSDGMEIEAVNDAWDDVKGGWLDREKVREARMEEVSYKKRKLLWDEVSRSDAWRHRYFRSSGWTPTRARLAQAILAQVWPCCSFCVVCLCPDRDSSDISLCIVGVVSNAVSSNISPINGG